MRFKEALSSGETGRTFQDILGLFDGRGDAMVCVVVVVVVVDRAEAVVEGLKEIIVSSAKKAIMITKMRFGIQRKHPGMIVCLSVETFVRVIVDGGWIVPCDSRRARYRLNHE